MATLTAKRKQAILNGFNAAYADGGVAATDDYAEQLYRDWRASGEDTAGEVQGYVNSLAQLYRLCPPGTEIMCVYIRSTPSGAHVWKVFVAATAYDKPIVAMLTGYLTDLGLQETRNTHEYEIIGNIYADGIAGYIGDTLYGDYKVITARHA